MTPVWDPARGNVEVQHGSSYIQVVGFRGRACPDSSTVLTYSQSANPKSPYFSDQTKLYSRGEWVKERFCEADILRFPRCGSSCCASQCVNDSFLASSARNE